MGLGLGFRVVEFVTFQDSLGFEVETLGFIRVEHKAPRIALMGVRFWM